MRSCYYWLAKRYEGSVKDGGILLSVHSDNSDWTKRAKEILQRTGAQDISSTAEAGDDYAKSDRPLAHAVTGNEAMHIPTGRKTAILDQQTDQHQCKQCGKSVTSETELREHEKTCKGSSGQQRIPSGMDSSEVGRKSFS